MSLLSNTVESDLGVIIIVYLSMFLDNVLLTVVVPIIPEYLYTQWNNNSSRPTNATTLDHSALLASSLLKMKQTLDNENETVGILLSSKAIVQLLMNPVVGVFTSYVGYNLPIFLGSILLIIISVLFAYGESFASLLIARSLQGTASALIGVSGMCLIADQKHMSELRRSKVMGLVMGSIALGVLVGYPFGGILYDLVNKPTPFIIIIGVITINLGLQLCILRFNPIGQINPFKKLQFNQIYHDNKFEARFDNGNWKDLLKDGYVLLITTAICLTSSAMATLEPFLPIWLIQIINPQKWQLGTVFIPDSLGYLVGTNFFGSLAYEVGQWRMAVLATLLVGISAILIPSATSMLGLICPHFGLGLGIGVVDSALVPMLASLVDSRHPNVHYGSVYALQQTAVSLAYFIGPVLGGRFVKSVGFPWLMRTIGILNLAFCCVLIFLVGVTHDETDKIISNGKCVADYNSTSVIPQLKVSNNTYKKLEESEEEH
ncbi:synaptic vesicular amine transporter-like isoform X2 [Adelges cooleyi]|uniref:synaptic vesicular amine transporter-like isoform X2 n=1 Tax=Adelges cooleyi TaxID=133065 RepID=UPI00217F90B7|nr:synaptic vesicular amine transporter-like isoform X2 [Adelges cooleyi]